MAVLSSRYSYFLKLRMFCHACGQQNSDSTPFCISCGRPLLGASPAPAAAEPVPASAPAPGASIYGSFWMRFVALAIDTVIIGAVNTVIYMISFTTFFLSVADGKMEKAGMAMIGGQMALWCVSFLIGLFYFSLMESSRWQGTLGKIAVNLKVVDRNGRRLSYWRALVRYASHFISNLTFGIGYLMNVFTARQQCLHDLIAGTLVVSKTVTPEMLAQHPVGRASRGQRISAIAAWCFTLLAMVLFVGLFYGAVMTAGEMSQESRSASGWNGKMREAEAMGAQASAAVAEYIKKNGAFPDSLEAAGFFDASAALEDIWLDPESGEIHLELGFAPLRSKSLVLVPEADADDNLIWHCVSDDVPKKSLPAGCVSTQ